jgi:hypothetical protein
MKNDESVAERVAELMELEEDKLLVYFHQTMENGRQKAWNDRHKPWKRLDKRLKNKKFLQGDQVMLYDSKYQKNLGKLQMHWLEPLIVEEIRDSGAIRITQIDGILCQEWVNGTRMKSYISI